MSEISARLLKGYNISYSTSSVRGGDKRMSDFSSTSSSSSNSSSNEGQQRTPDPLRDVSSSRNSSKERFSNRDACFKRRKIDELRYAASQVKEDLEKGGLPFPSVHAKKPRALEGFDINMSNIRLLNAASVADSPFLTKLAGKRSFQSYSDVSKLCNETQNVYSQRWSQEDVSSDWDRSSAGSLTSDSEASCVVDIAPLLEDSLKYQSFETKATHPSTLAKVKTVSMATALENNNEARSVQQKRMHIISKSTSFFSQPVFFGLGIQIDYPILCPFPYYSCQSSLRSLDWNWCKGSLGKAIARSLLRQEMQGHGSQCFLTG